MAQRTSFMQALKHFRAALILMCLIASPLVRANVTVEIHGVEDELRTNVLAYLSFERYKKTTDLSADTIERLHDRVEREVQSALRPFGYYEPKVHSDRFTAQARKTLCSPGSPTTCLFTAATV
jgi:hypothetical protein